VTGSARRASAKSGGWVPQITVGLLSDGRGFPLMVHAFEGNRAETTTMLPVLRVFLDAHHLSDITVVADAGMVSQTNQRAIEQAGLSFILGARVPDVPYVITERRDAHHGIQIPDGHVFVQPWPAGPADRRRDHTIFYQYPGRPSSAHVAGNRPADHQGREHGRAQDTGETQPVCAPDRRDQDHQPGAGGQNRALAGIKGYITNLPPPATRASDRHLQPTAASREILPDVQTDLPARPIYHRTRESIEAHLTIMFAALG
jgi:hypothetical protein